MSRADRVKRLLEHYADLAGGIGEPNETLLIELLADAMHFARRERIDFNEVLHMAEMHFEAEWEAP
jgi:hypothetical protein